MPYYTFHELRRYSLTIHAATEEQAEQAREMLDDQFGSDAWGEGDWENDEPYLTVDPEKAYDPVPSFVYEASEYVDDEEDGDDDATS